MKILGRTKGEPADWMRPRRPLRIISNPASFCGRMGFQKQETTMGKVAIALAISLVAASAEAQTRPSTVSMPCGASRQLVFTRGAIVLGTGGMTYDRFVRDATFCDVTEYAQAAYVPSIETPICFVGYRCKQGPRDLWDD